MEALQAMFKQLRDTDVTKTIHSKLYPSISPTRPELSQAGKVVLIPGGGTGVGFGIAKSFVRASAATIILIGRRLAVLQEAAAKLEQEAKSHGTPTKVLTFTCDVVNLADVNKFWAELASQGIIVDVFVNNVARFTEPKPLLELGADDVWSQVEVSGKAPLYFAEKFYAQPGEKQKFIVNVSTQATHMTSHPGVAARPAYTFAKLTGTLLFQLIAQNTPSDKIQIVSFHPGQIYNDEWKAMGLEPGLFDDDELCGGFAVWAATKEAQFLHGRFAWAAWDVDELATGEIRKRIDEDPYFLRCTIVGLNGGL